MRQISIQVQQALAPPDAVNYTLAITACMGVWPMWHIEKVDETTTNFLSEPLTVQEARTVWQDFLEPVLTADVGLRQCVIVTIQGKQGWDDYLLLHHFDPKEPTDPLSKL